MWRRDNGHCRELDQEDGEKDVPRDLINRKRHMRAPRVARCGRRHDRRQGRERAGDQRCGERKGEGLVGRRRGVLVGGRAATIRLSLSDDCLSACTRLGGSVHRAIAAARAASDARRRRGLPARALGPSRGAERDDNDERRRSSEQVHDCRMHGRFTGVNAMKNTSKRFASLENVVVTLFQ